MKLLKRHKSFGGFVEFYEHPSSVCSSTMKFSVYVPPHSRDEKLPVLYWLSGLTCTEETFMMKSGVQRILSEKNILLVAPDTSPRNTGLPGATGDWEVGEGAGFYVNATASPWSKYFKMYDYVTNDLPAVISSHFPTSGRQSIFGHSMGGHGALVIGLREKRYSSISAFAPIASPTRCPWGKKGLGTYLGPNESEWRKYDASFLLAESSSKTPILIDQGTEDAFIASQLHPEFLEESAKKSSNPVEIRRQAGFDHSYYFIATFIEEHVRFHAEKLR